MQIFFSTFIVFYFITTIFVCLGSCRKTVSIVTVHRHELPGDIFYDASSALRSFFLGGKGGRTHSHLCSSHLSPFFPGISAFPEPSFCSVFGNTPYILRPWSVRNVSSKKVDGITPPYDVLKRVYFYSLVGSTLS